MASYTDAISQFNPYVQQLPVDLMAKVGMQKQAQYDQGVQKIQSYIDNVAGMDIAHDADKVYLQSKLGQLGNRLKTVAAGDFSNQQLVNSVGGMTSQIIKDPNIQNAVASTAWYKKQKEELDKAYKDGKSSIANIDDFNIQAQKWLSTPEAGQRFTGKYTPFIDVDKHNLEIFKALHTSETGKDFVNERYLDPITGKLLDTGKLAAAMERDGVEGISAAKIEMALRSSYTPDILNQMRIDGNFQFKGVTPEQLTKNASIQYRNALQRTDEEIERLEGIVAMSDAQPKLQKRAKSSIAELLSNKTKLSENYNQQVKDIFANPDRAKLEIYKEGTIDQFSNAFSWEKRTTQVMANPQLMGQLAIEDNQVAKANLVLSQRAQTWKEFNDTRNYNAENIPTDPFMTILGEATGGLPAPLTSIAQSTVAAGRRIEDNIDVLLRNNPGLRGNRSELQKRLILFQNGDDKQFSGPMRSTAQAILDARKAVRENGYLEQSARNEIESNPEVAARKKQFNAELSKMPGAIVNVDGKNIKLSPTQLYELNKKVKDYLPLMFSNQGAQMFAGFSETEKKLINQGYGTGKTGGSAVRNELKKFDDLLSENRSYFRDVDNRVNGLLAKRVGKFAPIVENLDTPKPAVRSALEGVVGSALLRYDSGISGLSSEGGDVFLNSSDRDKAKGWLIGTDKADVQYKTVRMGDNRYVMMMKGTQSVLIKMTPGEAAHPTLRSGIDVYGQSILEKQIAFHGSTNATGKVEDAEYQRNFFKNTKKYPVVADLKYDPQMPEHNYINLQIKIGNSWQPLQLDENPMTAIKAQGILSNWTDADTEKILKRNGISIK